MKELRQFIIQFIHYGHGEVINRLNPKEIKCDGCEEDVNAIIEAVEEYKLKEIEKVIDEEIKEYKKIKSEIEEKYSDIEPSKENQELRINATLSTLKGIKLLLEGK